MIPLPASIKLKRNTKDEASLLEASRSWLERKDRAEGIHASDLLDLRQAYFKHTQPKALSDREVGLFLVGNVLHSFVLSAGAGRSGDLGVSDEGSRYNQELGIWYSIDWDKGDIAEFKTNRRITEPRTIEEMDTYLEQCLVYMAAKQALACKLWVLFLNLRDQNDERRTQPTFRCYTITIGETDLLQITEEISNQRKLLAAALEAKDPSGLPLCRRWKCGEANCSWWFDCKPDGRYGIDPKRWSN